MSLQGTLDTFALADVLRLLASTAKTGRLHVEGDRGDGDVWLDAGHVVAAHADATGTGASLVETAFELLRAHDGAFSFDTDMTTSEAGAPAEVAPLLEEAEQLLAEWREIEAVVPSMDARVVMAPELPQPKVWVNAEQWGLLVHIGSGTSVAALGQAVDEREVGICRAVKQLVESGLAVVQTDSDGDTEQEGSNPAETPGRPLVARRMAKAPDAMEELAALAEASKANAPELARQLAQLGPDAARAVAAAAQAQTPEEREAALASLDGETDGQGINRGLLLKFLSSVRS